MQNDKGIPKVISDLCQASMHLDNWEVGRTKLGKTLMSAIICTEMQPSKLNRCSQTCLPTFCNCPNNGFMCMVNSAYIEKGLLGFLILIVCIIMHFGNSIPKIFISWSYLLCILIQYLIFSSYLSLSFARHVDEKMQVGNKVKRKVWWLMFLWEY